MRDTHREKQRHRQREKQAPCRDPDAGLDPRTLGSQPEPKAETQPLSHPDSTPRTLFQALSQAVTGVPTLPMFDSRVYLQSNSGRKSSPQEPINPVM